MGDRDRETYEEHRALLALSMVQGIGPGRIRQLISQFGSSTAVFEADHQSLLKIRGISPLISKSIRGFDHFVEVEEQFRWADKAAAHLLAYWDKRYPAALDQIYDAPAFLWIRGNFAAFEKPAVAIVGTRKPSAYGARAAAYFATALAEAGFVIISGLAYGIDAVVHQSVTEASGATIAVLGSGIDRIYPSRHERLAREMLKDGAIISELPLRAKPDAVNFPRRNRIISGLALGTLVIEAFEKGGALITARLAVEQNREVFAVPGPVFNKTSIGCHKLIQDGHAKLVYDVDDILEEFQGIGGLQHINQSRIKETRPAVDLANMNSIEKKLYEALEETPIHVDVLCRKTGFDVSTALVYLLNLEFRGLVFQMAGKQFSKA